MYQHTVAAHAIYFSSCLFLSCRKWKMKILCINLLLFLRLPLYSLHSLARACGVCGVVWCYGVWCGVVYRVVGTSRLVYSAAILTACRVTPVVHCANRCKVNLPSSSPNTLPLFFFLPLNNCSPYSLLLLQQQPLFSQKRPTCWWQRR